MISAHRFAWGSMAAWSFLRSTASGTSTSRSPTSSAASVGGKSVLGFKLINTRETPDFKLWSVIHPCGFFIGLMSHSKPATDRFDERAVGLDHLALGS